MSAWGAARNAAVIELKIFNLSLVNLGGLHITWPKKETKQIVNEAPEAKAPRQGRLDLNWYFQLSDGTKVPIRNERILARLERDVAAYIAKKGGG